MNKSKNEGYFSVPDGPLSIEDEDHICHRLTISEFVVMCQSLTYNQLVQIGHELNNRISRISNQINTRDSNDYDWKKKAASALNICRNKKSIISNRLNGIRDNNLSSILREIGISNISNKRLALIRCLLFIIDNKLNFSHISIEEKQIIDLARDLTGSEVRDNGYSFDPTRMAIVSPNGRDVAILSGTNVHDENDGFFLARSWDMADVLTECENDSNISKELREKICSLLNEI